MIFTAYRGRGKVKPGEMNDRIMAALAQQYRPASLVWTEDPITGRTVGISRGRAGRHTEFHESRADGARRKEECYYCRGETTSTIFYVNCSGKVVLPRETSSMVKSREYLRGKDPKDAKTFYGMVKRMSRRTLPGEDWLARTFLNLVPSLTRYPELCLVTAVNPRFHHKEMHELPPEVMEAVIASWQTIEEMADSNRMETVPFINGGKRRESGQSVSCFHSQVYVTRTPELYRRIAARRRDLGCGVCEILRKRSLTVYANAGFKVAAHPAPLRNHSLLIAPSRCAPSLRDARGGAFADALGASLLAVTLLTGVVPAYNVAVRCGRTAGHLHAELIPKTETNIPAGFEEAAGVMLITEEPVKIARHLKRLLS